MAEIGIVSLPDQIHARVKSKGFDFTLMAIGQTGLGKSTLINSLFNCEVYESVEYPPPGSRFTSTNHLETSTITLEEDGVQVRLTVVDTPGFGTSINNSGCWETIETYIQEKFEEYERQESSLDRHDFHDGRVHCCLYFVAPCVHGLKALDIHVMRQLHRKVNIIPVIAKADTLTDEECRLLKSRILETVAEERIEIYKFPEPTAEEAADDSLLAQAQSALPFAICASQGFVTNANGERVRGRQYPWGVAEVDNELHSDFNLMKDLVLRTYLQNLIDVTNDVHYEQFRQKHLAGFSLEDSVKRASRVMSSPQGSSSSVIGSLERNKEQKLAQINVMVAEMHENLAAKLKSKNARLKKAEAEVKEWAEEQAQELARRKEALKQRQQSFEEAKQAFQQDVELHAKQNVPKKRGGFKFGH
eukprot:TRINITY_DN7380_c0_g1_i3.p1 TRINITY_DN7380_c0_g1~~TRINITY_DN7380_c0_g1_i3.p1  ORF type:complete len:417 (+),score=119.87 TRINITY_DN7380_c0_g1_i3:121-1371(+)